MPLPLKKHPPRLLPQQAIQHPFTFAKISIYSNSDKNLFLQTLFGYFAIPTLIIIRI